MTYGDEQREQHEHELDQLEGERVQAAVAHTDRENANLHSAVKRLEKENKELVEALQALGVTPYDYYCFCPPEMGFVHSGDHTGECRDAQQALAGKD